MKLRHIAFAAALAGGAATVVLAQGAGFAMPKGYLAAGAFDILTVLPPAPQPDDARWQADRAIFRATRALKDTPRWELATNDVKLAPADMMRNFSCAVGVSLTPENAPLTAKVVIRAAMDANGASRTAKDFYKRERPYNYDPGPVCQSPEELKGSFDYPSGHTIYGWTWATLLAQLAPDRATPIMARGRAYGESRIVCGVHNASAVDGGRLTAAATLAAVASVPEFQSDMAAARKELDALRSNPATPKPDAAGCARETELVAQRIF